MQKRKLQVFVSSTYLDLIEERQAAVEAILTAGHIPAGMELFAAGDEEQMKLIRRWIDESDVYLLIIGTRYGSIDQGSNKSYTELEYDYAVAQSKRHFVLVVSDTAADKRKSKKANREENNPTKLREFIVKAKQGRIVREWSDVKDIQLRVIQTLSTLDSDPTLKGWIRADSSVDLPKLATELSALGKENRELREEVAKLRLTKAEFVGWDYEHLKQKLLGMKVSRVDGENHSDTDPILKRACRDLRPIVGPESPLTLLHLLLYARFDNILNADLQMESDSQIEPGHELVAMGLMIDKREGYALSETGARFVNQILQEAESAFPYGGESEEQTNVPNEEA
ncbi:MAG: DUF4062 domain-containing protein [Verrucomicrobiales bacterium]|nr:DUF4062 domain-containing protein [Verrucomicrobiales bacterium]